MNRAREERLQIMLSAEERSAIDDWRFRSRMPSRAAAVRELLRRGLLAEGFDIAGGYSKSGEFGVLGNSEDANGEGEFDPPARRGRAD